MLSSKPRSKQRTSHQAALLYPVPRKILAGMEKQTNHAHIAMTLLSQGSTLKSGCSAATSFSYLYPSTFISLSWLNTYQKSLCLPGPSRTSATKHYSAILRLESCWQTHPHAGIPSRHIFHCHMRMSGDQHGQRLNLGPKSLFQTM